MIKARLDKLAASTHRSNSYLAAEAVREFVEINEWRIQEIENVIKEANADDFSTDQELQAVLNKWGVNGD